MKTEKWVVLCVAVLLLQLVACERSKLEENAPAPVSARTRADSIEVDSMNVDSIKVDTIRIDSIRVDSVRVDSIKVDSINVIDSTKVSSIDTLKLKRR